MVWIIPDIYIHMHAHVGGKQSTELETWRKHAKFKQKGPGLRFIPRPM